MRAQEEEIGFKDIKDLFIKKVLQYKYLLLAGGLSGAIIAAFIFSNKPVRYVTNMHFTSPYQTINYTHIKSLTQKLNDILSNGNYKKITDTPQKYNKVLNNLVSVTLKERKLDKTEIDDPLRRKDFLMNFICKKQIKSRDITHIMNDYLHTSPFIKNLTGERRNRLKAVSHKFKKKLSKVDSLSKFSDQNVKKPSSSLFFIKDLTGYHNIYKDFISAQTKLKYQDQIFQVVSNVTYKNFQPDFLTFTKYTLIGIIIGIIISTLLMLGIEIIKY